MVLKQDVDVLCIQELKAHAEQLQDEVFQLDGYTRYILSAEKAGYSGVAIYTRLDVDEVIQPLEGVWLKEGRLIGVKVLGIEVYSLYLPSGTQGDVRQSIKYTLMDELHQWMSTKLSTPTIIVGDWNIAHQNIDLKNWKSNQKTQAFYLRSVSGLHNYFPMVGLMLFVWSITSQITIHGGRIGQMRGQTTLVGVLIIMSLMQL